MIIAKLGIKGKTGLEKNEDFGMIGTILI